MPPRVVGIALAVCLVPWLGCSLGLDAPDATFAAPRDAEADRGVPLEAGGIDSRASDAGANRCQAFADVAVVETITAATPEFQAWLGYQGAIAGDSLVLTAPFTNAASRPGAVFDFVAVADQFGASMPIDDIVGSPGDGRLAPSRLPYFAASGSGFGSYSVALDGDLLVVGIAGADGPSGDGGSLTDSGVVHVLRRGSGVWELVETLQPPGPEACALFGRRVAVSGGLLLVGAPGASLDGASSCDRAQEAAAGAVHVYRDAGSGYRHHQTLKSANPRGGDFFGDSLEISDGRIVVGAPFERRGSALGAAYVFRDSGAWEQEARVENVGARPESAFGTSIALDGDLLVVGAPLDDRCGGVGPVTSGGRAYVYRRTGASWAREQCLTGAAGDSADLFGWSLAIAGDHLVVGAPFDSSGDGAAYLFERAGDGFSCVSRLRDPHRQGGLEPVVADEVFGTWVAMTEDSFFVGAPRAPVASPGASVLEAGAVYRFSLP